MSRGICSCRLGLPDSVLSRAAQLYHSRLSAMKQPFVPHDLSMRLAGLPGIVARVDDEIICVLAWSRSWHDERAVVAQFYVEAGSAPEVVVDRVFTRWLTDADSDGFGGFFELWVPPDAKAHNILPQKGFLKMPRVMLASEDFDSHNPGNWGALVSVEEFASDDKMLNSLSSLLKRAYQGCIDSAFYRYLQTVDGCKAYLRTLLRSTTRKLDPSLSLVYVANRQPRLPLAMTACYPFGDGRHLYLEQLAVDPAHHHKGIAGQLMRELMWRIAKTTYIAIYLTVRNDNVAARHLYGNFGFSKVSEEAAYVLHNR